MKKAPDGFLCLFILTNKFILHFTESLKKVLGLVSELNRSSPCAPVRDGSSCLFAFSNGVTKPSQKSI